MVLAISFPEVPLTIDATVALVMAIVVLAAQLALVRPRPNRRSDAVLAGYEGPRSHAHLWYVGTESVKVVALLVGGILALAG
ncbi:hypothetical protein GCM10025864_16170 [Luteimicrobium album]|uniref:Uncharacterized protein n=1 Tax=Luteimicrobium album TaxID=1054550 RepID=A0ABQ6I1N9_9MICO|nr:hypothetical protein [Luteimicrobium album]GMA23858.1 hypothetical protein GCM10025864_16170 [Luteimicrobium album]